MKKKWGFCLWDLSLGLYFTLKYQGFCKDFMWLQLIHLICPSCLNMSIHSTPPAPSVCQEPSLHLHKLMISKKALHLLVGWQNCSSTPPSQRIQLEENVEISAYQRKLFLCLIYSFKLKQGF